MRTAEGDDLFLKVAPPGDGRAVASLQLAAMTAAAGAGVPVQPVVTTPDGRSLVERDGRIARLTGWLPGELLGDASPDSSRLEACGRMLGRTAGALAELELDDGQAAASVRWIAWDLCRVIELSPLVEWAPRPWRRELDRHLATLRDSTMPALATTRRALVHNDFHGGNVLVDEDDPGYVTGVLDFGDVVRSAVAADLATAMSYTLVGAGRTPDAWAPANALRDGYLSERELTTLEVDLLRPLVRARLVQRVLMYSWRRRDGDATPDDSQRGAWEQFEALRG